MIDEIVDTLRQIVGPYVQAMTTHLRFAGKKSSDGSCPTEPERS